MVTPPSESSCIIVLSTKSSGSSALQELICNFGGGRHLQQTRHGEFETLYWTKAASVLGLPQVKLPDSEVPLPKVRALHDLRTLIAENTGGANMPADDEELVVEGWRALCLAHRPVFVEKSPHHLHQWSCLKLMTDVAHRLPDVDFRFVGLVRNPMDVLYSAWSRWRLAPEDFQHHWRQAYENLQRFRDLMGERLVVVRYEDFSAARGTASRLLKALRLPEARPDCDEYIHGASRSRWKADRRFGFQLDRSVIQVATQYGYDEKQLINRRRLAWPMRRVFMQAVDRCLTRPTAQARRVLKNCVSKDLSKQTLD